MRFTFSEDFADVIFAYLAMLVVANIVARAAIWPDNPDKIERRRRNQQRLLLTSGLWIIAVLVLNGIGYAISISTSNHHFNSKTRYVAQAFGLESGKTYPLVLGSRLGGEDVRTDVSSGLFSVNVSVTSKPASVLSVSFTSRGDSFILELPNSLITYRQSSAAPPQMKIVLANGYLDGAKITNHYSGCSFEVHNLFTTCARKFLSRDVSLTRIGRENGLSGVVGSNVQSVSITLTPDMYKRILGG